MTLELDLRGLRCPLPVLRTKKAMKNMPENGVLSVITSDPGSISDFSAFCSATGNKLLESAERDNLFYFSIQKMGK